MHAGAEVSWKPGDLVMLNEVWGRQQQQVVTFPDDEKEGDVCFLMGYAGSGVASVWRVIHGPTGREAHFHEAYFDRIGEP